MVTRKRYSGFLTVTLRLDDSDDVRFTVSHGKKTLASGWTRLPDAARIAVDSSTAFDRYAHAALSFGDAENGDVGSLAEDDEDGSGFKVSRRKPVRSAAKNGRDRLKRTKRACAARGRATRKGSSKAASRLATHCKKRRSRKAR